MEHIFDQPCKRCNGVSGLSCKVCDGLGMTASLAAVQATMESDPFATATAQGMSFRLGQAMPKANRSVLRGSWPFGAESKTEKAKPSSWPF